VNARKHTARLTLAASASALVAWGGFSLGNALGGSAGSGMALPVGRPLAIEETGTPLAPKSAGPTERSSRTARPGTGHAPIRAPRPAGTGYAPPGSSGAGATAGSSRQAAGLGEEGRAGLGARGGPSPARGQDEPGASGQGGSSGLGSPSSPSSPSTASQGSSATTGGGSQPGSGSSPSYGSGTPGSSAPNTSGSGSTGGGSGNPGPASGSGGNTGPTDTGCGGDPFYCPATPGTGSAFPTPGENPTPPFTIFPAPANTSATSEP